LSRGEAAIFVPGASRRREVSQCCLCRGAEKTKKDKAETQKTLRNRREEKANDGDSRDSLKIGETN
jgi:hypothetical protein